MNIPADRPPARPVYFLVIFILMLCVLDVGLFVFSLQKRTQQRNIFALYDIVTAGIGLSDLCIATEARYTRHPAVTDLVVPFMDYPGAIEHFPTGSFWTPPAPVLHSD